MNDDRLLSALQRLGRTELPTASDRAIRGRLETAWTTRANWSPMPASGLRRFAPVLATVLLVASFGGAALGASADSPLWNTRVALEEAATRLRQSNDDRIAYLLDLVQSRTEEAARQEAAGNPGAATKARVAAAAAVVQLHGDMPQIDATVPSVAPAPVVASPSVAPTPANSASPAASRSASAVPAVQLPSSPPPTATRTTPLATPTPVRTPLPSPTRTPSPTPLPSTGTKQPTTITGTVRDVAGNAVTNACISTSPTSPTSTTACGIQTKNGSYAITASVAVGQSITLYAYYTDPATGALSSGAATGSAASPTTLMPTITLTPRR